MVWVCKLQGTNLCEVLDTDLQQNVIFWNFGFFLTPLLDYKRPIYTTEDDHLYIKGNEVIADAKNKTVMHWEKSWVL